jgi:hypothetical protein
MLHRKKEDPNEKVFLVCANCNSHWKGTKSLDRDSRRDCERGEKDKTFQEWRGSKQTLHNSLEIVSAFAASTPSTILLKEFRKPYGNSKIERGSSSTSGICWR